MDPLTGGLLIGGATSLINGIFGVANNNQNLNNSLDLAAKQQQYAIQNWNMQNAYNAPAAQMGRFKAAGLNPNLVYGQMSNSPSIASPQVSPAQTHPIHVDSPAGDINALAASQQSVAQTHLIEAQTKTAEAQANYANAQAAATLKNTQLTAPNIEATTAKSQAETASTQQNLSQSQQLFPANLEHANLLNQNLVQNTAKSLAESNAIVNNTRIANVMLGAQQAKTWAEVANLNAATANKPAERDMWLAAANNHNIQSEYQSIQSKIAQYQQERKAVGGGDPHDNAIYRFIQKGLTNISSLVGGHYKP